MDEKDSLIPDSTDVAEAKEQLSLVLGDKYVILKPLEITRMDIWGTGETRVWHFYPGQVFEIAKNGEDNVIILGRSMPKDVLSELEAALRGGSIVPDRRSGKPIDARAVELLTDPDVKIREKTLEGVFKLMQQAYAAKSGLTLPSAVSQARK